MKIEAFPGEVVLLTFKLEKGSCWLTSHRLIICEHEEGRLEGQAHDDALKNKLEEDCADILDNRKAFGT